MALPTWAPTCFEHSKRSGAFAFTMTSFNLNRGMEHTGRLGIRGSWSLGHFRGIVVRVIEDSIHRSGCRAFVLLDINWSLVLEVSWCSKAKIIFGRNIGQQLYVMQVSLSRAKPPLGIYRSPRQEPACMSCSIFFSWTCELRAREVAKQRLRMNEQSLK